MAYVAMIGLLFVPLVLLLFCGWNFVKYYSNRKQQKDALSKESKDYFCSPQL